VTGHEHGQRGRHPAGHEEADGHAHARGVAADADRRWLVTALTLITAASGLFAWAFMRETHPRPTAGGGRLP
jgi:hypothetical protein